MVTNTPLGDARRLNVALDAARMAVWDYEIAAGRLVANPGLNRLLGFPADASLDYARIRALYCPGEEERLRQAGQRAVSAGESFFEIEYRTLLPSGGLRWFQLRAEIVKDETGAPIHLIGVLMDVTERKKVESQYRELLRNYEAQSRELSAILDAATLAAFDVDLATGEVSHSPQLNLLYGYPPQHPLSLEDIFARYHPEDAERLRALRQSRIGDPAIHEFEVDLRLLLPDGGVRWLNERGHYLRHPDGQAYCVRGVAMDVSERKRLEDNQSFLVRELEHRIKNILATVVAIATQTMRKSASIDEARRALTDRLQALALGHQVVVRAKWGPAPLREVVETALAPYLGPDARMRLQGPDCRVSARQALTLTLALHELATNAVKYGALSGDEGAVAIRWITPEPGAITFTWEEDGGPEVHPPGRVGFGTQMIKTVLAEDFHGHAELRYRAQGLVFEMTGHLAA